MSFAQTGNLLEAIVWMVIGAILLARSLRATEHAWLLRVLAATFAIFGLSDVVEIRSGAWWKPPWLLGIKAVCVASFALYFWNYLRRGQAASNRESPP